MPRQLSDWLSLLESRHPVAIDLGLDRVGRVAQQLGLGKPAPTVITVAGTNGKGSCIAVLQAVLKGAGYSTAAYTSPHLIQFNERVVIRGRQAEDGHLCDVFERIELARVAADTSLTYFEFTTLAAMLLIEQSAVDVAFLEVGLGGRLDAVNLIDSDIAVVTGIALDHQDWLGNTLDIIGYEKASIARPGKPFVYGDMQPVDGVIKTAAQIGARLYQLGVDFDLSQGVFSSDSQQQVSIPDMLLPLTSIACALQVAALMEVDFSVPAVATCLGEISLPGRCQSLSCSERRWLLDVAHNPQAATRLGEKLQREYSDKRIVAIFAAMEDKDIQGIVAPLQHLVDQWVLPRLPLPRSASPQSLGSLLYNSLAVASPWQAVEQARQLTTENDLIVVFGSFFVVGPILDILTGSDGKQQNESLL